jgi:hypothetical protein
MQAIDTTKGNKQIVLLTKAQREALFRLFRRDFPRVTVPLHAAANRSGGVKSS